MRKQFLLLSALITALAMPVLTGAEPLRQNDSFVVVSRSELKSNARSDESWGTGEIVVSFLTKKTYAKTYSSEEAYRMKAQLKVFQANGTMIDTPVADENYVKSVKTVSISPDTPTGAYGTHEIQKVKSGGWQTAKTSYDY